MGVVPTTRAQKQEASDWVFVHWGGVTSLEGKIEWARKNIFAFVPCKKLFEISQTTCASPEFGRKHNIFPHEKELLPAKHATGCV